jgi:hypothetical protein
MWNEDFFFFCSLSDQSHSQDMKGNKVQIHALKFIICKGNRLYSLRDLRRNIFLSFIHPHMTAKYNSKPIKHSSKESGLILDLL